ncbi:MAG TPA: phage terminase large subunit family protein [Thermoanaerobaculia bacterium]|nr:phage terminase large subunit family protein [Thermoanaerobaculia bacterium]
MVAIIDDLIRRGVKDARVTTIKGEQIGFTTLALAVPVWAAVEHGYNGGYFLPDDAFAKEWGLAKLSPIINESPYLSAIASDGDVERGTLKQFRDKHVYVLGLAKLKGATSRPMDLQVSDEVDLTSEAVRKWKTGRMRHSHLRFELDFSAPYAANSGIDKRFTEGSQRRWLVDCGSCMRTDVCLEESFPECMQIIGDAWQRVCPSCKAPLDVAGAGRFVPLYPERETGKQPHYSFRISALVVTAIDGNAIMRAYEDALASGDAEDMAIFNRSVRAMADAGAMQPITEVALKKMERPYTLRLTRGANEIFFGIDLGKSCWFWAEEWLASEQRSRLVYVERMHSNSWERRTHELIAALQPRFGVSDMMPLFDSSQRLASEYRQTLALLQFENGKDLTLTEQLISDDSIGSAHRNEDFTPKFWLAKVDRNRLLAQWCGEATHPQRGLIIPDEKTPEMLQVREHLKKLQKVTTKDAKGNEIHRFIDNVDNHYGLAAAAARVARLIAPSVMPFVVVELPQRTRRDALRHLTNDAADDETMPLSRGERLRRAA